MNILYLATGVFDKGGISRYSRYQIEALRKCKWVDQVYVMSLHPPEGNVFETHFPVEKTFAGVLAMAKLKFTVSTLLTAFKLKPQIIWSNHINLCPVAHFAACMTGSKSIVNIYGREIWSGLNSLKLLALGRSDHVISDCYYTANWAEEHLKIKPRQMSVIWDCVDIKKFTPGFLDRKIADKYGVRLVPGRIRLMTLGRLESEQMHKGYDRILGTLARIKDFLPVDYIIGGTGPALPNLQKLAGNLGLKGRVYFTGSITEADLPAVYRLADVFVLISDRGHGRGEGIPLTPLEAAACGKPILVGNEDGSQEAAEDGVNGFILSPHDQRGLIDRIRYLVENGDIRHQMGMAAKARVEQYHSFEGFACETQNVIKGYGLLNNG